MTRRVDEKAAMNGFHIRPKETITISMFGRRQTRLREMIQAADTVFLPPAQKAAIVDGIQWFIDNPVWHTDRSIPYRYGILLYGPPGTGKTTLATALSSHFNKPVFILNLATVQNDNELLQAFASISRGAVILIEDIDAAQADRAEPAEASMIGGPPKAPPPKTTLSGLLNAIDGVAAAEDRILLMTTNYVERIDAALLRKGRIDARYEIGPLAAEQVVAMATSFFPNCPEIHREMESMAAGESAQPAAEWQDRMATRSRAAAST